MRSITCWCQGRLNWSQVLSVFGDLWPFCPRFDAQLVDKVVTLELESSMMKDENWVHKEELAALKEDIEQLKKENKAYQEELAAAWARLRMASATKQSSMREHDKEIRLVIYHKQRMASRKHTKLGESVMLRPASQSSIKKKKNQSPDECHVVLKGPMHIKDSCLFISKMMFALPSC